MLETRRSPEPVTMNSETRSREIGNAGHTNSETAVTTRRNTQSASISLAVLEYTVNYRRRGWVPATVLGRATIPSGVRSQTVSVEDLPANWYAADPPMELQDIGREWLERGETAVLKVPSAIVVEECNYLLNPLHADFGKLTFGAPKVFSFDRRVTRSRKA